MDSSSAESHPQTEVTSASPLHPDFSCRTREFDILRALLRRTFFPHQVSEDEARLLGEHLEQVRAAGKPSSLRPLVFVRGRSGMGKTRLMGELAAEAQRTGIRVKEICCYERQGIPFLPMLRMVKDLIVESGARESIWRKYSRVLSRVFPELAAALGEAADSSPLPGDDGKLQLFDALAGILMEISREQPLLLLLHDLQRSDPGTVEFLRYLGRNVFLEEKAEHRERREPGDGARPESWKEIRSREQRGRRDFVTDTLADDDLTPELGTGGARLLVVANSLAREEPPAPAAGAAEQGARTESSLPTVEARLEALEAEPFVCRLSLPPLTEAEVATLVERSVPGAQFSPEVIERLTDAAGGNPLYALEICRTLVEEGGVSNGDHGVGAAATALLDELLPAASADGAETSDDPLSPEEQLCRRLIRRRLELPRDEAGRSVLEVLAVLRRPATAELLASILELSAGALTSTLERWVDREFVQLAPLDGEDRYALSHEDYTRCLYADLPDERRAELHGRVGQVLAGLERAGEPVRAFEIYEHLRQSPTPRDCLAYGRTAARYFAGAYATELAATIDRHLLGLLDPVEDRESLLTLLRELSELELRLGRVPEAKGLIKRMIAEGETHLDDAQRLDAMLHLAEVYRANNEPHKGIKVLHRAQKSCASAIDERTSARVTARLARLRLTRQDPKRAANLCLQALKSLEEVADSDAERIELLEILAAAQQARGDSLQALQHYQTLLRVVEPGADDAKMAVVLAILGQVYYARGNFFRAARYLFRALDAIRRKQDLRALSGAYDLLGKVYRNSGDLLRALEYFSRSLRLRERIGDEEGISPTLNSLGSLYAHCGDYARALRCFKRGVENAERLGDTEGIVRSFLHLGRAYHDIGELKQVESLVKQILILSQEFGLTRLEGEGYRLQGELFFFRRDWKRAERDLRRAIEISSKHARKEGEAWATLALGSLLAEKEEHESALKHISRAQLLADDAHSLPLRARCQLEKGNVHRFLRGGNLERARECFEKGMALVAGENHLPILWELEYSMAKLSQTRRDFPAAGAAYQRAESILDRIARRLPDDMRVVFRDDSRRRTFFEDYRRFQKEASGRLPASTSAPASLREESPRTAARPPPPPPRSAPVESGESGRLLEAIRRVGSEDELGNWSTTFFREARRLVPAPAGFLASEAHGRLQILASVDMAGDLKWIGAEHLPGVCARVAIAERTAVRSGDAVWSRVEDSARDGQGYRNRSVLVVPIATDTRVLGAIYLERPSVGNPFTDPEQQQLESMATSIAGHLAALLRLEQALRLHGTRMLSLGGFDEQLQVLARRQADGHGEFEFVEVVAPGLDPVLECASGDATAREAAEHIDTLAGSERLFCAYIGDDRVVYGFEREQLEDGLEVRMQELQASFARLLEAHGSAAAEVHVQRVVAEAEPSDADGRARALRRRLYGRESLFNLESEIGYLTRTGLSLKEAKGALEKRYITAELSRCGGNITKAAGSLGVHRPQLSNLIKKHNVKREDFDTR